ncbi:[histone H3]-lysine(4) N-trimethyltransferase [Ranunculus cassubicifolius]
MVVDDLDYSSTDTGLQTNGVEGELPNVDLTDHFTTDRVFETREELIRWAGRVGKECGCIIVIRKSDHPTTGRKPRLFLGCERGGKYRTHKKAVANQDDIKRRKRKSGSKKCDCPFVLRGVCLSGPLDQWKVTVECGHHNHPLATDLNGNAYGGRLTAEERQVLFEMTLNGVKPKQVLTVIKERDPNNSSKLQHIYNARARLKTVEKNGKSQMQQLMPLLDENDYIEWNRKDDDGKTVTGLFWAHPESIQLAKCFPYVFIMESTNKTNKYRWPVFEVVGVTSTLMPFSVCFAMFEKEREDNYVWALERLYALLDKDTPPLVIVTDGEASLFNSIEKIFPDTKRLLCRWHIQMSVLDKAREFLDDDDCKILSDRLHDLILSSSENDYNIQLEAFERDFSHFPSLLHLLKETWLPHKELFIAAWTDHYMHLGCITNCRIESAHAKLKRQMSKCSMFDFVGLWKVMHSVINEQITEIRLSFERSLNSMKHDYRILTLKELKGCISREALDLILAERKLVSSKDLDTCSCTCVVRSTHGLPCAHDIAIYDHESCPIPLSSIHPFWKKLSGIPTLRDRGDLDNYPEFQMFVKHYQVSDDLRKKYLLKKLKELADSATPWLVGPLNMIETEVQPKCRKKRKLLPIDSVAKVEPSFSS